MALIIIFKHGKHISLNLAVSWNTVFSYMPKTLKELQLMEILNFSSKGCEYKLINDSKNRKI